MGARPRVAIVGAGKLGTALALALNRAGFKIDAVVAKPTPASLMKARGLARKVRACPTAEPSDTSRASIFWFCVPDAAIEHAAQMLAGKLTWKGRIAFHSSGALSSDVLASLRRSGAAVASVHPFMTFVRGAQPSLEGVPFAIEGDAVAVRTARQIVRRLGGQPYPIRRRDKAAYHAWGTFASPFFVALLITAERVARLAGVKPSMARKRMMPILQQTLKNYERLGPAGAFSGPIIRGDVETIKRHLETLHIDASAETAYLVLARAAVRFLPARNQSKLMAVLSETHRH